MSEQSTSKEGSSKVADYEMQDYVPRPVEVLRSDRELSASETYIVAMTKSPEGHITAWTTPAQRPAFELARLANQIHDREHPTADEQPTD